VLIEYETAALMGRNVTTKVYITTDMVAFGTSVAILSQLNNGLNSDTVCT